MGMAFVVSEAGQRNSVAKKYNTVIVVVTTKR